MGKQLEATHSACMRVASGSVGVAGRRRKILRARSIITMAWRVPEELTLQELISAT